MGVLKRDSAPQRGRGLGLGLSIFENLESLALRQCGNEVSRGRGSPCTVCVLDIVYNVVLQAMIS